MQKRLLQRSPFASGFSQIKPGLGGGARSVCPAQMKSKLRSVGSVLSLLQHPKRFLGRFLRATEKAADNILEVAATLLRVRQESQVTGRPLHST